MQESKYTMKKSIMRLAAALLLTGMLLAPVDNVTAHADSDTCTDDTADEPEIILLVVVLNILVRRWKGLRLVDYFRFSNLMKG